MTRPHLPLVSVVMPAYNMADYIAESIESVLASDYEALELIVVDDGSTDNTAAIAQGYAERDSRVSVIVKANGGQTTARNAGVASAKGEYILLVDSDDLIGKQYISKAVAEMERDPEIKVVTCRGEFFGNRTGSWNLPDYTPSLLARRNLFTISSLLRRSDYLRVGGFDESLHCYCEDWAFWIAILKDGGKAIRLPSIEFYYRVRGGSSRFVGRKYKGELVEALNRRFPDFFERELGGRLHSQRSMSRMLNALTNLFRQRKVRVTEYFTHLTNYLKALPRLISYAAESGEALHLGDCKVEVREYPLAICSKAVSDYRKAVAECDFSLIGCYTERRWLIFTKGYIVHLKKYE